MVTVVDVSEATREREAFRYESSLFKSTILNDPIKPVSPSQLHSASDPALTAFAQLAVLRLKTSRALISLFDSQYQYIIAEATPDLTLLPDSPASKDSLWLSGTHIPRSHGVCEHVLQDTTYPNTPRGHGSLPVSVINDLTLDSRYADCSFVKSEWPHCRFYAGVPIQTHHGINIGALCIFDDEPRSGLDADETRFMWQLSRIIMRNLEAKRSNVSHNRTEGMVRGLSSFVDGTTTLTNNDMQENRSKLAADVGSSPEPSEASFSTNQEQTAYATPFSKPKLVAARSTAKGSSSPIENGQPLGDANAHIRDIYTKAANTLRSSMDVDGIIFLDAHPTTFGGATMFDFGNSTGSSSSSSSSDEPTPKANVASTDDATSTSTQVYAPVLGFSDNSFAAAHDSFTAPKCHQFSQPFLRRLLRRYPRGCIFNFNDSGTVQSSDVSSEESNDKPSSPPPMENTRRKLTGKPTRMKETEQEMLMELLPEARCIVFAPVWDPSSQRWSAGTFAYTTSPSRVFNKRDELNYLIAFGTIVTSEVSRLKATTADKSKMDMLSSLSHELRSPLHGIVLSVEMLHDSALDGSQKDALQVVETCGRTLLDTVDHLLHWTKINNFMPKASARRERYFGQNSKHGRRADWNTSKAIEAGMMSITADVSVDALVEDVVESVFAGHTYQKLVCSNKPMAAPEDDPAALRRLDRIHMDAEHSSTTTQSFNVGDVMVTLNFETGVNWVFNTQAGALRRVIMNLFGNSLKYTSKGFVNVSLTQHAVPPYPCRGTSRRETRNVRLVVSDSGKGISDDYIANRMFVPFSQEDRLSPGVGLGLSLVKRIVSALDGRIKVQSRVGTGTSISVELPLQLPNPALSASLPPTGHDEYAQDSFEDNIHQLKGRSVSLLGFSQKEWETSQSELSSEIKTFNYYSSLVTICREWLHLTIIEDESTVPDLLVYTSDHLNTIAGREQMTFAARPILVVCPNMAAAREMESSYKNAKQRLPTTLLEFSSQPLGPRKLARLLACSLEQWKQLVVSTLSVESTTPDEEVSAAPLSTSPQPGGARPLPSNGSSSSSSSSCASPITPPSPATTPDSEDDKLNVNPGMMVSDRFLIVDDNPINLKVLSACIKKLGQLYDTASNGQEAVDAFRKRPGVYKCILMDLSMPIMSGFEAACVIRQEEKTDKLAACSIFALTGLASAKPRSRKLLLVVLTCF